MGHTPRSNCRDCGRSGNEVRISRAGYCPDCGTRRLDTHNRQQAERSGAGFDRWLAGWAAVSLPEHVAQAGLGAALHGGGTSDRSAAPRTP